jgi:hypothetical protein
VDQRIALLNSGILLVLVADQKDGSNVSNPPDHKLILIDESMTGPPIHRSNTWCHRQWRARLLANVDREAVVPTTSTTPCCAATHWLWPGGSACTVVAGLPAEPTDLSRPFKKFAIPT